MKMGRLDPSALRFLILVPVLVCLHHITRHIGIDSGSPNLGARWLGGIAKSYKHNCRHNSMGLDPLFAASGGSQFAA